MRPRHKAAENAQHEIAHLRAAIASMRPRHKAAENPFRVTLPIDRDPGASMRPRHKAAENIPFHGLDLFRFPGFNEAAA